MSPVSNPYAKGSPFKKKASRVSSKLGKAGDELVVHGIFPTVYELYAYSKISNGQIKDGYTYPFRMFIDGDANYKYPHLEEAGFVGYYVVRRSPDSDERLNGSDGYARYYMVRCVPGGSPTTKETRMEGLNVLSEFFKHPKTSKYPPASIRLDDLTTDPPKALNHFLRDVDIFNLLENSFEKDALTPLFVKTFPDLAKVIFGGPTYPAQAVDRLGYGVIDGRVPGFFPGGDKPRDSSVDEPEGSKPTADEEKSKISATIEEKAEDTAEGTADGLSDNDKEESSDEIDEKEAASTENAKSSRRKRQRAK